MSVRVVAAVIAACQILVLSSSSPLLAQLAQDQFYGPLAPREKKIYHACLYAHWIDNYCRFHAWGFNDESFTNCVIANGACGCVFANGGYWGPNIDSACRALPPAQRL